MKVSELIAVLQEEYKKRGEFEVSSPKELVRKEYPYEVCVWCGERFEKTRKWKIACSPKCQVLDWKRRNGELEAAVLAQNIPQEFLNLDLTTIKNYGTHNS